MFAIELGIGQSTLAPESSHSHAAATLLPERWADREAAERWLRVASLWVPCRIVVVADAKP